MAINLTEKNKALFGQNCTQLNLILEVIGFPFLFGVASDGEFILLGETEDDMITPKYFLGDPIFLGQKISDGKERKWISLGRTTKTVSQQLKQSQGGSTSIARFNIEIADINKSVGDLFRPGNFVEDILGNGANVYILAEGASYPNDAVKLITGAVDTFSSTPTSFVLSIASAESQRRTEAYFPVEANLNNDILAADLTIQVNGNVYFYTEVDTLTPYIRINDEIIRYETVSFPDANTTEFFNVQRGQFGTIPADHSAGDEVTSAVRIQGNPIDVALKMQISGIANPLGVYASADGTDINVNRINFGEIDVTRNFGVTVGDDVIISYGLGSGQSTILAIDFDTQFYIIVSDNYTSSIEPISCSFVSRYATFQPAISDGLAYGAGINPVYIDIAGFERIRNNLPPSTPDIDIYLTDSIDIRKYLDEKVYAPNGLYSIERQARISIGETSPPFADAETKILNADSVKNGSNLVLTRTTNKDYYNTIRYNYNFDEFDEDNKSKFITISTQTRIDKGPTVLEFNYDGLKRTPEADAYIQSRSERLLDRYDLAPVKTRITVPYQFGFNLEIGDPILFDYGSLEQYNYETGERDDTISIFEITNKSWNWSGGDVTLEALDTGFGSETRYAGLSQSSLVAGLSDLRFIQLKPSFSNTSITEEANKWESLIGRQIRIVASDYSSEQIVNLNAVFSSGLLDTTGLVAPVNADDIVEVVEYDDASALQKTVSVHMGKRDDVLSAVTPFNIDVADSSIYFIGKTIRVYNEDFTTLIESEIINIAGNTIELQDNGETWDTGVIYADQLGFASDSGKSYGYI